MNRAALILAAGASTRLGQPKQLLMLNGETLLDRSVRIARAAGCDPIVVVLGASEQFIRAQCDFQDVLAISNPDWQEGMGTSLSLGTRCLKDVAGVLVMTCDMPAMTSEHLIALSSSGKLTASSYADRKGVPAYFPKALFPQLMELTGDTGARGLLSSAQAIALPGGELDIDTPEDLARFEREMSLRCSGISGEVSSSVLEPSMPDNDQQR